MYILALPHSYQDSMHTRAQLMRQVRAYEARNNVAISHHIQRIYQGQAELVPFIPDVRPAAVQLTLEPGKRITEADLSFIERYQNEMGRTLVEVDLGQGLLTAAELTPAVQEVRARVARALGVRPYEIDVSATWDAEKGIDGVYIRRLPYTPEAKLKSLLQEALAQVGGTMHWETVISLPHSAARLTHCDPDRLVKILSLADTLPSEVKPAEWKHLPLGQGPQGEPVCQDLTGTPHGLTAGPTGSGKTIALLSLCTSALTRGHSLVMIDPTKGGVDFLPLKPFCLAWATTLEASSDAIIQVYAEVARRKKVLGTLQRPNWQSATAEERAQYSLTPITVLIDEFGSLALEIPVPKSLPKDDPLVMELQAQNAAKAIIKTYAGKIAREARFAGVFLQIALQRPDAAIMGSGEFRSNLGMRTQLVPPAASIDNTTLGMLFESEMLESVRERMNTLSDGSHGLAIVAGEGGMAQGVKIPYSAPEAIEQLLHERGVPEVTKPMVLKEGTDTIELEELPEWWREQAKTTAPKPVPDAEVPAPAWTGQAASADPAW